MQRQRKRDHYCIKSLLTFETKQPEHIAIIMDGNGRWATKRNLPRMEGHNAGADSIDRLMDAAIELKLKNISLYAFSTENWKRPVLEVRSIFQLLDTFIDNKLDKLIENQIRILHSGSRKRIPKFSLKKIDLAIEKTKEYSSINLNFCLNYGSHEELTNAFNQIIQERKLNKVSLDKEIKAKDIERHLYTHPLPPVDLMIRTGGEQRISNFLLWQIAYSEIYFCDVLWPDFSKEDLVQALDWYKNRHRRFGGL